MSSTFESVLDWLAGLVDRRPTVEAHADGTLPSHEIIAGLAENQRRFERSELAAINAERAERGEPPLMALPNHALPIWQPGIGNVIPPFSEGLARAHVREAAPIAGGDE